MNPFADTSPEICFSFGVETTFPSTVTPLLPASSTVTATVYFPDSSNFAVESRFAVFTMSGVSANVFDNAIATFPPFPMIALRINTAAIAITTTAAITAPTIIPILLFFGS